MRFLRGVVFSLGRLVEALLLGWASGLRTLIQLVRALLARLRAQLAKQPRDRRKTDDRCVPIRHPSIRRPDPLIYSQTYLMSLGLGVSWDNPDIQLLKGGIPVSSDDLQPATDYEVVARVWNGSTDAPVVDLPVTFTVHGFGIGTAGDPIGQTTVPVLGVKGGPNCPAFATVPWTTPATPGHYCIKAHLEWVDDSNPNNNVGQENTNVVQTASPAEAMFLLRNDDRERTRRFRFDVDAYVIPDREPCTKTAAEQPPRDDVAARTRDAAAVGLVSPPARVRARHERSSHPLPPGWTVQITPEESVLAPQQTAEIHVHVEPPPGFHGQQRINVNGFDEVGLAGGVTLVVEAL